MPKPLDVREVGNPAICAKVQQEENISVNFLAKLAI